MAKVVVIVVLFICFTNVAADANPCFNTDSGFLNDYSGCRNYFTCFQRYTFAQKCELGRHFNETLHFCDLEAAVKCVPCPATGSLVYREAGSCTRHVYCINGVAIRVECEAGQVFNVINESCVPEADFKCDVVNHCPLTGLTKIPNDTCKTYDLCFNGENLGSVTCPNNKWFDQNTTFCVEVATCPELKKKDNKDQKVINKEI